MTSLNLFSYDLCLHCRIMYEFTVFYECPYYILGMIKSGEPEVNIHLIVLSHTYVCRSLFVAD